MKASLRKCALALRKYNGRVSTAAKELGMSFQGLYERIRKNERLQKELQAARDDITDLAEEKLRENIEANDTQAIIFALRCLGKDRGYADKPDVAIGITLMDPAAAAAMIER